MAQLLQYNCYARFKEGAPTHRHSKDRERPFPILFFHPSQVVILCLHSMERAKGQPGRHGVCVLKLQMSSPNWANILHRLKKRILRGWRSLSSWCMTDPVQLKLLMMHSWNSLPGCRDPMKLFPQLMQLLFNTLDALHTRQHAYGFRLWCASLKRRVLLNRDGNKKETAGVSYGLCSHQLLRVASNSQNASARRSVVDGASATSSVWAAWPCAAAPAKNRKFIFAMNNAELEWTMLSWSLYKWLYMMYNKASL